MPEIVDKGELRRQLARSERERLDALAIIETLEQKLREVTAERYALAGQMAQVEHQLRTLRALNAVQVVLTVVQAAHAVRTLTQGSWFVQLWRRLRGRSALVALTETVEKFSP